MTMILLAIALLIATGGGLLWQRHRSEVRRLRRMEWRAGIDRRWARAQAHGRTDRSVRRID